MKTLLMLILMLCVPSLGWGTTPAGEPVPRKGVMVQIVFQENTLNVLIEMFDNPASRDFMALLPLTVDWSDFASTEKIAHLPRRLNTTGSPTPQEATGDFTYYAPWGNLAVFYKGFGTNGQLYILGRIVSGKDVLTGMNGDFTATIQEMTSYNE